MTVLSLSTQLVSLDDCVKSEHPLVSLDDCVKSEHPLVSLDDCVKLPGKSVRTFRGSRRICDRGPHLRDVGPKGLRAGPSQGLTQRGRF